MSDVQEELERLRAALQFYANEENWKPLNTWYAGTASHAELDQGRTAREALKSV